MKRLIKQIHKGTTLVELVLAVAILSVVFTAVVPLFTHIRQSTKVQGGASETIQNTRVLLDHIQQQLACATEVNAVSTSDTTLGYIQFFDNDANLVRYEVSEGYVYYGPVGDLSLLAGPVSQFQFSCYALDDLETATTDVNSIRMVTLETTLANTFAGSNKSLQTTVFIYAESVGINEGLMAHWKFDETSGTTAMDSGAYGYDGTLVNMAGTEWTAGVVGGALDFDGSNDYVNLPIGVLVGNLDDCTVTGWVNWSAEGSDWQRIFDFGNGETENMFLTTNTDSENFRFGMTMVGWFDEDEVQDSDELPTGWRHVAVTMNATSGINALYLDGSLVDSNEGNRWVPSDLGETPNNYLARSNYDSDPYFQGCLDDIRIFNRALDTDEIATLANAVRYLSFTETKVDSDSNSITISTPSTEVDDLLIAAVATDGDISTSLTPPVGEGWREISVSDYNEAVTLGVWWKLADVSESSSHQFTWTADERAYGWIMQFRGNHLMAPIEDWAVSGSAGSSPTSPAVSPSVENCLILRLGAFDGSAITTDATGLSGHGDITMDASGSDDGGDVTSDLVAHWKMDDGSGTSVTDSVGSYDGTMVNMDGTSDWVTGHVGGALDFDGSNDYVSLPIGSVIKKLQDCSIAVWVNWEGSSDFERIWDFGKHTNRYMYLTPANNYTSQLRFSITTNGSSSSESTHGSSALSSGWHHVVVTIEQTMKGGRHSSTVTHNLYVDGVLVGSNDTGSLVPDDLGNTRNNWLGRSEFSADPYFDGQLDDLRIYDDALTSTEITQLYQWTDDRGEVSGGAGYVSQGSAGSSDTANFSLTSSKDTQALTIAIAPNK